MRKSIFSIIILCALIFTILNASHPVNAVSVGDSYVYDLSSVTEVAFNNSAPHRSEIRTQEVYNVTAYNETTGIINFTYQQMNILFGPIISENSLNLSNAYTYISWTAIDIDHDDYYDIFNFEISADSFVYNNKTRNIEMLNKTLEYLLGNASLIQLIKKDFNAENNTYLIKLKVPVSIKVFIVDGFATFRGFMFVTLKLILTSDNVVKLNSAIYSADGLENPKHGTMRYIVTAIKVLHEEKAAEAPILGDLGSLLAGQSIIVLGGVAVISLIVGVVIGKKT
ncbi:MAG: hypothetical protein ACP6IS_02570 [Candidatus Asgardarchaeia archaeon]